MITRLLTTLLVGSSFAAGYYHFLHFPSRNQPLSGFVEKFDLNSLPDSTVTYQIMENGPGKLADGDSFPALVSQIRAAARVWSGIETSTLQLRFGGLSTPDQPVSATPGIDVVFEELPPGVNGYGGPTSRGDVLTEAGFLPVQRAVVVLNQDLAKRPSWSEQFYLTAVHEFGHALGLQHSFTSGAMATEITRGTTKIRPITPDDIAGISVLYPTAEFRAKLGTVSGRVTMGEDGVHLASVVAIAPSGAAVGALSNADGTYKIEGVPPGTYFVYAHPLPPAAFGEATPGAVVAPVDEKGKPMNFGPSFDTVFYPSSRLPEIAVYVKAGKTLESVDFSVKARSAPALHGVQTYSFPAQIAVRPAHIYTAGSARNFLVATGNGLVQNSQPVRGLQIQTLGGFATITGGSIRPYAPAPAHYLQAGFQFSPFAKAGPGHLIFSTPDDIYVLPNAFFLAERPAPQIDKLTLQPDGRSVLVEGKHLNAVTRIHFDGEEAPVLKSEDGRLTVSLPSAPEGHRAAVTAFQPDGQSSLFVQSASSYTFEGGVKRTGAAGFKVNPSTLPAGTDSLVEITTPEGGSDFSDFGFSTSDVRIQRIWQAGSNRLLVNVWIAPAAAGKVVNLTVMRGLQILTQKAVLQITAQPQKVIRVALFNGAKGLVPGRAAELAVSGAAKLEGATVVLGEKRFAAVVAEEGVIRFAVPADLPSGPIAVKVQVGDDLSLPIGIQVLPPPTFIKSVTTSFNRSISASRPARPGDILTVTVSGVPENVTADKRIPKIHVVLGGVVQEPLSITTDGTSIQYRFVVTGTLPEGQVPFDTMVDSLPSTPITLALDRK